jgi:hypothetical protein
MPGQSVTIKRSELYEKVWSTPMTQLATVFGISDVALGKTCKRHNIPKPGLGYWAKLEHGKKVKKTALPESKYGDYEITISASLSSRGHKRTSILRTGPRFLEYWI